MIKFSDLPIGRMLQFKKGAKAMRVPYIQYQDEYGDSRQYNFIFMDGDQAYFPDNYMMDVGLVDKCATCANYDHRTDCPISTSVMVQDDETFYCSKFKESILNNNKSDV